MAEVGGYCSIEAIREYLEELEFSDEYLEEFDRVANNILFQAKIAKLAIELDVATEEQIQLYQDHSDVRRAAGEIGARAQRDASENNIRVKLQSWRYNGNLKRNRDGLLDYNGKRLTKDLVWKGLKTGRKYSFVLKEAYPDDYKSIIARAKAIRAERKVKYSLARFQRKWRESRR
ncbi:hypothetical protein ACHAWO_001379 [Cyclotella atomus]|uniref:Uncharacterized protein n=1 Tax=Cyclotella atomus TaxID=382360 RepID=A0ABD3QN24_9STRA